jgi:hypothetical protein
MLSRILPAILFVGALFGFSFTASGQNTFAGSGFGLIPDSESPDGCQNPGAPLDVTFNVTGLPGAPTSVSVEMAFAPLHMWGGDVVATLIAPNGTQFVIFGNTGNSSAKGTFDGGDGSDLIGPYTFNDSASANWWTAAENADDEAAVPSGAYRTSSIGGLNSTGSVTSINAAFAGIPTSDGTWTLRFTDGCNTDSGGVASAKLTLSGQQGSVVFQDANVDMNGLGRSDFVVIREENFNFSAASADRPKMMSSRDLVRRDLESQKAGFQALGGDSSFQWWTLFADAPGYSVGVLGNAITDWYTPADFDGDNEVDIAVWRPGAADVAGFYWIKSTDGTLGSALLGVTGDNPAVVGDYDGDNIADPAVFRCPETGGQCYFFYRGTNNNPQNNVTYWPLGYGDPFSVLPYPGDFDGDQKYDFCVFRSKPDVPDQGQFVLQVSSALNSVEYIEYGLAGVDFLVPGDYDADGKTDFAVARPSSTHWNFFVYERDGGGNPAASTQFGLRTDFITPGDYDGDGKTDLAIYRWGTGGGNSQFWVLRSSDGQVFVQPFGLAGDVPAARWRVQ